MSSLPPKTTLNPADLINHKMQATGFSALEIAVLIGLGPDGETLVNEWINGKLKPSPARLNKIQQITENPPFKQSCFSSKRAAFKFIDLFAGIGGLRLPFQQQDGQCVFSSEWDKHAQITYSANFGEIPHGDITQIPASVIPKHDLLLAGFPCQTFSQAGLRQGFNDTRGTMFFEIQRILAEKRPKAFVLENVKQLRGHQKGKTLEVILSTLRGEQTPNISSDVPMSEDARAALGKKLNYWVDFKILRAADFGIPQNRERIFIIGFDKDQFPKDFDFDKGFSWPEPPCTPTRVGDILEPEVDESFTISDRLWAGHKRRKEEHKIKGNGFGYSLFNAESNYTNTISARYYKDGSEILIDQSEVGKNPRKLTPRECARLQGFPEEYIVDAVSSNQVYKQFGNSVCMKVVQAIAEKVAETLKLSL